jgi:hypothetical protein
MNASVKRTNHDGDHSRRQNALSRKCKPSSQGSPRRARRPNVSQHDANTNLGISRSESIR